MISILSKITIFSLIVITIKSHDNPEMEFELFLKNIEEIIREIAKKYQDFERNYRRQSYRTKKLLNGTIFSESLKELEKPLKKILFICSSYLKNRPFELNDAELIEPKKVCNQAYEAISEYEAFMIKFLSTHDELQKNTTQLNVESKNLNSTPRGVGNITQIVNQVENLVNASYEFSNVANQAAFNTSNVLFKLKTRTLNYCGSKETTTRRLRKRTTTKRLL